MTPTKLLAWIETGGTVETQPDAAGLFAFAQREGEAYVFYEWRQSPQLVFERFETGEALLDRMQGFAKLKSWRSSGRLDHAPDGSEG